MCSCTSLRVASQFGGLVGVAQCSRLVLVALDLRCFVIVASCLYSHVGFRFIFFLAAVG